jgi:hypothetical protein
MRTKLAIVVAVTCLHAVRSVQADECVCLSPVVSVYVENDSIYFKPINPTDRWYTSGLRVNATHSPQWGEKLAGVFDWLPIGGEGEPETAVGYSFIHKIFTPVHIGRRVADPDDHPYSGWLAFGFYLQRATESELDHFEVDLGVVGPSARGEPTQNFIHDLTDSTEARGWDAQLHDEFGFDFVYARKWKFRLVGDDDADVFGVEAIPQVGFTLGSVHRHIEGGGVLRAGWNLPDDFGPGRIDDPLAATGTWTDALAAYGFVRVTGRVIEHDMFVEGNNWESSAGVDEEHLVGEVQLGFALRWRCVQLTYGYTLQSERFEDQSGSHGWGMWGLSFRLPCCN